MVVKKILISILIVCFFSCKEKIKQIDYFADGGYKEFKYLQNGDTLVRYFNDDGTLRAKGNIVNGVELLKVYHIDTQLSEIGQFRNNKRTGWHTYYNKNGVLIQEIFYINNKIYQTKVFEPENGQLIKEYSVYVDIHLPIDTLPHNKEVPVHLQYLNGKSQYKYVRVYVSNKIDADFSNINNVVLDTFGAEPKEKDIYFLVKFPNKGKNYVRGYLFDGVQDDTNLNEFNGIKVLFEKEVYVK